MPESQGKDRRARLPLAGLPLALLLAGLALLLVTAGGPFTAQGGTALAQQISPTPGAIEPPTTTPMPTPTPAPTLTTPQATAVRLTPTVGALVEQTPAAMLPSSDPRLTVCSAPTQPGFVPVIVRPGDRLSDLLTGVETLTPTQIAALNCIDDPAALPVGVVIWIPGTAETMPGDFVPQDADPESDRVDIAALTATPETLQNENGVYFEWQTTGTAVYFYRCLVDLCQRPTLAPPRPPVGGVQIDNFPYAGEYRYRLEVVDGSAFATRDITITVECSHVALGARGGTGRCPDEPPLAVFAAWQPFEGGALLWFADTGLIYVLTAADSRVRVFEDAFVEGQTEPEITAPEGLYAPVRGFGLVWRTLGGAESALGWALAAEGGYDALRQPAGRQSYTVLVRVREDVSYALTLLPGAREGYWAGVE